MQSLIRRLLYWINRGQEARDLEDEIEHHRALRQEALERAGMSPERAARDSRRALGNRTLALEDARTVWTWVLVEHVLRDVRYAARTLARERTFAVTAIVTLALAIAVTATVFAVVDAALWRPLPFPQPDRLVAIYTSSTTARPQYDPASPRDLLAWRGAQSLRGVAASTDSRRRVVLAPAAPESITVRAVTTDFFDVLEVQPARGRGFVPGSAAAGEAVLSHDSWVRLFGSDPQILGRHIEIDGEAVTIVGMTAASFRPEIFETPELYVAFDPARSDAGRRNLITIGRLGEKVSVASAAHELEAIATRVAGEFPDSNAGRTVRVEDLRTSSSGADWRPMTFFLSASGFVLLLACINVAGLLLARAQRRQRELAIRRALGGGPTAIARQLVVEGAVLAAAGATLGVVLAIWMTEALPAVLPADYLGRETVARIDARALLGAIVVTAATALLFGLAPAVITRRGTGRELLGHGGRTAGASRAHVRARNSLVVIEITLALVLLFSAGLFLNSFVRLTQVPIGFEPRDVLTFQVATPGPRYAARGATDLLAGEILDRISALPGVRSAALTTSAPLGSGPVAYFRTSGSPSPADGREPRAILRAVSPGYFSTLGIQLLAGRSFDQGDGSGGTRVAIVNERLARLYGGRAAIGRPLELLPGRSPWVPSGTVTIVGIATAVKELGFNEVEFNGIYLPAAQVSREPIQVVVKTSAAPGALAAAVRREIRALDPVMPVLALRTMDDAVAAALQQDRFNLLLSATFALLATIMAALGLYGVMTYAVEQRTREFGVRLALGSSVRGLLGLALRQGLTLAAAGVALGIAIALVIAHIAGSALYLVEGQHNGILFEVSSTDPVTLLGTASLLLGIAFMASLGPAIRATRVDPVTALRAE
ncbi:MAG TPA: ABC transporter permease [Gemmatimonadales bacterium]|nr:ABC transporter permease [Gemmatimonadales bacterium]